MASNQRPPKKKKKGDVDRWCTATVDTRLKNMNKNKPMSTGAVTL